MTQPASAFASATNALAERVAGAFGDLPRVVAVAMGGSRSTGGPDDASDIDLYVYAATPIPLPDRAAIITPTATRHEIGNAFWEPGDEWIDMGTGTHVDVMYRSPDWIEEQLDRVLVRHEASVGYSTCFWHNVLHSTALFDRTGWYGALQESANRPYPELLKRAIVARNHPILRRSLSSYLKQIEQAMRRGDGVSVQHRVTALLASYFDILFAVNEIPHPGEKRLVEQAVSRCARQPRDMEARINALLATPCRPTTPAIPIAIGALLDGLDELLAQEGLLAGNERSH